MSVNAIATTTTSGAGISLDSSLYVPLGVIVSYDGGAAVSSIPGGDGYKNRVYVDGTVAAFGGSGISLARDIADPNHLVQVGETGIVRSMAGTTSSFAGVAIAGEHTIVDNSGLIEGTTGISLTTAASASIANSGTIWGLGADAIHLQAATGAAITNSGALFGANGIHFASGDGRIVNSGEIHATATGIDNTTNSTAATTLINTGSIFGGVHAIALGLTDDVVKNFGFISGDLMLGGGADTFRGGHEQVDGTVNGEAGGDTLWGSAADDDVLSGGADNDVFSVGMATTRFRAMRASTTSTVDVAMTD